MILRWIRLATAPLLILLAVRRTAIRQIRTIPLLIALGHLLCIIFDRELEILDPLPESHTEHLLEILYLHIIIAESGGIGASNVEWSE